MPSGRTWGELEDAANAGDTGARAELHEAHSEMASGIAKAEAARRHALSALQQEADQIAEANRAVLRRKERRERAMLWMTGCSCGAAVIAAAAAVVAVLQ